MTSWRASRGRFESLDFARGLLHVHQVIAPEEKIAWLDSPEGRFEVRFPLDSPASAVIELTERIYHSESIKPVSRARAILRHRIFSTTAPTLTELEVVKVVAKRISAPATYVSGFTPVALPTVHPAEFRLAGLEPGSVIPTAEIPYWLEKMREQTSVLEGAKWRADRPVSALLLDGTNRVLAFAWNKNAILKTRHAEMNLCSGLSALPGGKIPNNSQLYVSLKPCRMCAARIWEAAADPAKISVFYVENDPGRHARGTLLDFDSPSRIRYLGPESPLRELDILRKFSVDD